MSTEMKTGTITPANDPQNSFQPRKNFFVNTDAYLPFLQEYCELMVKKGIFEKVSDDHAIGKYRGLTYKMPNGHWAKLKNLPNSRSGKPTAFIDYDPTTKTVLTNANGNTQNLDVFDMAAIIHNVDRWDRGAGYHTVRVDLVNNLGDYVTRQVKTYDDKLAKTAIAQENQKNGLNKTQRDEDARIRRYVLKEMNQKLLNEIQRSGTLFGTDPLPMPVKITAQNIAYMAVGYKFAKLNREDYMGKFPSKSESAKINVKKDYMGRVSKSQVGSQLTGLMYVAAMQDGEPDKRYMELNDMLNTSRFATYGIYNPKTKQSVSSNYCYGADFGFRERKNVKAPEIISEVKANGKYKILSLKDPITAEVNHQISNMIWVKHEPAEHLTVKSYVNVSQISLRELDSDPNNHDHDKFVISPQLAPIEDKAAYLQGVANKAIALYGICINDEEAFRKDPVGEMRNIIRQGTKLKGNQDTIGGQFGTENDKIHNYGMRAFQRELTLDYIMRSCGYKEGIVIPEKERAVICKWIADDMTGEKGKPGERLLNASIAMDKNNIALHGMSKAEKQKQNEAIMKREKFADLSVSLESDYTTSKGVTLNKGAGKAEWSKPITKQTAYDLLADICYQDKYLYSHPEDEKFKNRNKDIVLNVKVGDQKFEGISLRLGHLDTGNEATVADSLLTLLVKNEKEAAYSRKTINENFAVFENAKEAGLLRDDLANLDKEEFVGKAKDKYVDSIIQLSDALQVLADDESRYKQTLKEEGKFQKLETTRFQADVYRYVVPTKNKTLLYEAYDTSNVVRLIEPHMGDPVADALTDTIVELRRPLEPLKDKEMNSIGGEKVIFGDISTRRARPTETLEAVPYRNQAEWAMQKDMNDHLSMEFQPRPDEEAKRFTGIDARDKLMQIALVDKQYFDKEKEGYRSVENLDPVKVTVKWNDTVLFEKSGRMGSKSFSNVHSVEELIGSQREQLSEEGQKALDEMLKADREQEKYSDNRDLNTTLQKHEVLEQKEIDKILKAPKQVEEYRDEANKEGVSLIDQLETEAVVNFKEDDQAVIDHIVDGMIADSEKNNPGAIKNPETIKAIAAAIRKERPGLEDCVKKSLERKSVQKKVTKTLGIKRKGPSPDHQR